MKKITLFLLLGFFLLWNPIFAQNPVLVQNAKLTVANLGGDNYTLGTKAELTVTNPVVNNGTVNFTSDSAWLILNGIVPSQAISTHLAYITVNGVAAQNNLNVKVTNYMRGCVIMAHSPTFEALSLFKDVAFTGGEMKCTPFKYYKSVNLGSFNNTVSSFKLKKGYMATFAQNENGSGFSKVFIAEKDDIEISTLQVGLNNQVSFVRVFPWRYTDKKGFGSGLPDFNRTIKPVVLTKSGWFYHWGPSSDENLTDVEFVPMKWTARSMTDPQWQQIATQNYSSHLLGFNEPDADTQANMSLDEMILYWPKMMESGLRLGSPAPAGNMQLLYDFVAKCDELNYRVDFVAIHDYGEGSALNFYNKCKAAHDATGRPVWVTEFNSGGTWTNSTPTYEAISQRITEIMEKYDTAGIIERYSIFNFDETVNDKGKPQNRAVFVTPAMPNYTPTLLGTAYTNNVAPMAFTAAEQIDMSIKLVAPQGLKGTNISSSTNRLTWENLNFTGIGKVFIERAFGSQGWKTIAQINVENSSYDDDISATGNGKYSYRLSVRETGYTNSKSVIVAVDVDPNKIFNVALNKAVFATSIHSDTYPAEKAVDGNIVSDASRWVTKAGELPAYIDIDLNGFFLISQLKFYSGFQGYNSPITGFKFQYWDVDKWTDLVTETSNASSTYSKSFAEVRTNKVRLNINATGTGVARFYEIEVYGKMATLGLNEFSTSKFAVYPNPTSDFIEISSDIAIENLEIFDINAKKLIEKKNAKSIDVSNLSVGTYFIKINKKDTIQFIKK